MKVTFLGTGTSQGIPMVGSEHPVCLSTNEKDKRLRASCFVEVDGINILIDCGPDFRQQVLRSNIQRIDAILFTHEHADHTGGLDDTRPFCYKQGNIPIYGNSRTIEQLKTRFQYIFKKQNRYPGAPKVDTSIIGDTPFSIKNIQIIPINVMHGQLEILGFRIKDFAYITDAKTIRDDELEKLKGIKILVVNALRIEPHNTHFNLEEAIDFSEKIGTQRVYFTHISHRLGFHKEISQSLPKHIHLAYDTLSIETL